MYYSSPGNPEGVAAGTKMSLALIVPRTFSTTTVADLPSVRLSN